MAPTMYSTFLWICSIAASELVEVGKTQIEKGHSFEEDGVKGAHHVLEEALRGVEDLHGAYRKEGRKKKVESDKELGEREIGFICEG